jgi:hypothetical protein
VSIKEGDSKENPDFSRRKAQPRVKLSLLGPRRRGCLKICFFRARDRKSISLGLVLFVDLVARFSVLLFLSATASVFKKVYGDTDDDEKRKFNENRGFTKCIDK